MADGPRTVITQNSDEWRDQDERADYLVCIDDWHFGHRHNYHGHAFPMREEDLRVLREQINAVLSGLTPVPPEPDC